MRRVVVAAVGTVDRTARAFLRKAASLAKAHDAQLHLVHVIALPYGPLEAVVADVGSAALDLLRSRRAALAKLARAPELRALRPTSNVSWDYPASDGLVREALRRRAILLIAQSQRHARLARVFLSNTDWDLIRNCPCPLWLCKSDRPLAARGRALAALDPLHQHAKPAGLDRNILRSAIDAAGGDARRVLAFHAYGAEPRGGSEGVVEAYWAAASASEREAYVERVRRKVAAEAARCDIPAQNVLIASGDPATALPRAARKHGVNVVVMGALSRRGLRRLFIGNTAERVIDALSCDVLVVKPRGFKTPVPRAGR